MHHNLEVDFLGKMANFDSLGRKTIDCGHLVKVILVIFNLGTRLFAHYNININIYIIVAVLTASVFDFDQMTNDQMTACL